MSYHSPEPQSDDNRSLKELLSELSSELRTLLQQEVELAKVELQEQASRAAKAGVMLGGGAGAGLFAVLLLSFAAAWGLAQLIPTPLGFLVVGAAAAAALLARGRREAATIRPPAQTLETLKQDVKVAKEAISAGASGDVASSPGRTKPWEQPRR
ncbi:MAG: phage holin family protein [Actinobacteria bacterium]|nr:phage holin family protein [Actinomycetota bacterium]